MSLPNHEKRFDPESLGELAPAERKVIEYLLGSGPEALTLSAKALAKDIETSDATVVRAAKALGYSGLGQLRLALAVHNNDPQLGERLDRTLREIPEDQLLSVGIEKCSQGLDTLAARIPPELFERAVDLLSASERIVWHGVGPTGFVADYARFLCNRLGRTSTSMTQSGAVLADELLSLSGNDVLVIFSYGAPETHVTVVIDEASEIGCPVVLITDRVDKKLRDCELLALECGRGDSEFFPSHALTLLLVESLILGVVNRDSDRAHENLDRRKKLGAALAN